MKVKTILQNKDREIISVKEGQSLLAASRLLAENRIGVVLVLNAQNEPVGIISERDIVREFAGRGPDCAAMKVQDVMTKDLIVGSPEDDLDYVMTIMTNARIRHLPILDGSELVGLISIGDVVKAHVSGTEAEIHYLRSYITGNPTG